MEAAREIVAGNNWKKRLSVDVGVTVLPRDGRQIRPNDFDRGSTQKDRIDRGSGRFQDGVTGGKSFTSDALEAEIKSHSQSASRSFHETNSLCEAPDKTDKHRSATAPPSSCPQTTPVPPTNGQPWRMRNRRSSSSSSSSSWMQRQRPMSLPGNFAAKFTYSMLLKEEEGIQCQVLVEEKGEEKSGLEEQRHPVSNAVTNGSMNDCKDAAKTSADSVDNGNNQKKHKKHKQKELKREKSTSYSKTNQTKSPADADCVSEMGSDVNVTTGAEKEASLPKKSPRLKMAKFKWNQSKFLKFWKSSQENAEKT